MQGESKLNDDITILSAVIFMIFVNLCAWSMLSDGDTGWHIAAGNWILDHRAIPTVDPFSYTFAGKPWVAHEWLSEVLMALAYRAAGWSGIAVLFASAVAGMFFLAGLELRRWLSFRWLAIALTALFVLLQPFMLARPHMLAWPMLAIWTIGLLRARERDRAPPLALAALMVLWANLHGSFVFGFVLLAAFGLEALIAGRARPLPVLRDWGMFAALSLAASLLTPHGIDGLMFPLEVSGMSSLPLIIEWQPTAFGKISGFEVILLATLFLLLSRGVRVPPVRLILLLGMLHLALAHIRHQALLGIVGTLILAAPAGNGETGEGERLRPSLKDWRSRPAITLAILALILSLVSVARLAVPMKRPDTSDVPVAAVAALPDHLRAEHGFNRYGFGGLLILNGFRPYIDGRADLYGDAFLHNYARIANGDASRWNEAVRRWNIRWAILSPKDRLATVLASDKGWRRLYADKWAIVFVKR